MLLAMSVAPSAADGSLTNVGSRAELVPRIFGKQVVRLPLAADVHEYAGLDALPEGKFSLGGWDASVDQNEVQPSTITDFPQVHQLLDGSYVMGLTYVAPVTGACAVMGNLDANPDPGDKDSVVYYGAFDVKKGDTHYPGGTLGPADSDAHAYVIYVVCFPEAALDNAQDGVALAKSAIFSKRYEVKTRESV